MRRFSSYGPLNQEMHYFAPRKELIEQVYTQLTGYNPPKEGHYLTVWAPRQTGKTWLMREVVEKIKLAQEYETGILTLEGVKDEKNEERFLSILVKKLNAAFDKSLPSINQISDIPGLFTRKYFEKPVILLLDEFDALEEEWINRLTGVFRNMYITNTAESKKSTREKTYLLHGLAMIGVRAVLGIGSQKSVPFNVQRSFHVPNLTFEEVEGMFQWYEKESGQKVEKEVVRALYDETLGQPGLTCWFGELLTETYNHDPKKPMTLATFNKAYGAAPHIPPNNNILNLISKVNKPPYDDIVMELFKTGEKIEFKFNDKELNYLYMNGVINQEKEGLDRYYVKFTCPFVQKSLFDYLARKFFNSLGSLIHPLDEMTDAIDEHALYIPGIVKRYRAYLKKEKDIFLKNAPRRKSDLKVYEAVYHFNLYRYLYDLLRAREVEVIPQFPTGNGKIDLLLRYKGKVYALELKSFKDMYLHRRGIEQAADYARQLGLNEIAYLVFVELSEDEAKQLEQESDQKGVKVIVLPVGTL